MKGPRPSTGDASRLAALLLSRIGPSILPRRVLPDARLTGLGATRDLHHGLLDATYYTLREAEHEDLVDRRDRDILGAVDLIGEWARMNGECGGVCE